MTAPKRLSVMEDHLCKDVPMLERGWYYAIEVEPGVWTNGRGYENVHLTREALRRIDVRGLRCLDIGTMEGLIPVLLCRRGAKEVYAYDRLNFSDRLAFIKEKLGVSFCSINGPPLTELAAQIRERGGEAATVFDVVVFSGVLYHMLDIIGGLLLARRHVRPGGIMLVETAAVLSPNQAAELNAHGRFFPGDNFWLPALGALDTLLRFVRLKPLDATYLRLSPKDKPDLIRVCVPCLAVEQTPRDPQDYWLRSEQKKDFAEYIDWAFLAQYRGQPIDYDLSGRAPVMTSFGTADVYATAVAGPEMRVTDRPSQVNLAFGASF